MLMRYFTTRIAFAEKREQTNGQGSELDEKKLMFR